MKNILDKLDLGAKFFIIAVFGIAVIYCILSTVFGLFKEDSKKEKLDINNINSYILIYSEETGNNEIDKSKIVRNYSDFYTIQSAIQNYITALIEGEYSKTYDILSDEMKEKYSKKEYYSNVEKLTTTYFFSSDSTYDLEYCLVRTYNIKPSIYLCECKTLSEEKNINIAIEIDNYDSTYKICYIDFEM